MLWGYECCSDEPFYHPVCKLKIVDDGVASTECHFDGIFDIFFLFTQNHLITFNLYAQRVTSHFICLQNASKFQHFCMKKYIKDTVKVTFCTRYTTIIYMYDLQLADRMVEWLIRTTLVIHNTN